MLCNNSLDRRPHSPLQPNMILANVFRASSPLPPPVCAGSCIRLLRSAEVCVDKQTPFWFLLVKGMLQRRRISTLCRRPIEGTIHDDLLFFQLRSWTSGSVRTLRSSSTWDKSRCAWRSRQWTWHSNFHGHDKSHVKIRTHDLLGYNRVLCVNHTSSI